VDSIDNLIGRDCPDARRDDYGMAPRRTNSRASAAVCVADPLAIGGNKLLNMQTERGLPVTVGPGKFGFVGRVQARNYDGVVRDIFGDNSSGSH